MAALSLAVTAQDSTRQLPGDGPIAKLVTGRELLGTSNGAARDLLLEVIAEATDTAVLAEAHKHLADAYINDNQLAAADSVFKALYEKFPDNLFAPEALFRRGVILLNNKQYPEARAIFNRVIERYPDTDYVQRAKDRLLEIPPPP
jgi:TolA-binding protein